MAPAEEAPAGDGTDSETPPSEPAEDLEPECVLGEFGAPERLSGLELEVPLWGPALGSADMALFFAAEDGGERLFRAARSGAGSAQFSEVVELVELSSGSSDGSPFVSASGLDLYFYSTRPGGSGLRDIWRATRAGTEAAFGEPVPVDAVNSAGADHLPRLSGDELSLTFTSNRAGGSGQSDIWQSRRDSLDAPFGPPTNLVELNTAATETGATLSADGLSVVFSTDRDGGQGGYDIWRAVRASTELPFESATPMDALNSPADELDVMSSSSGIELLFSSSRDGIAALWRSVRVCQ